jgi:hypothetical protein
VPFLSPLFLIVTLLCTTDKHSTLQHSRHRNPLHYDHEDVVVVVVVVEVVDLADVAAKNWLVEFFVVLIGEEQALVVEVAGFLVLRNSKG